MKGRHRKGSLWAHKVQPSPAAHRSQCAPWMCSSACGITAGTGKVEAVGLQWDVAVLLPAAVSQEFCAI